jgi:hypothetical protein
MDKKKPISFVKQCESIIPIFFIRLKAEIHDYLPEKFCHHKIAEDTAMNYNYS